MSQVKSNAIKFYNTGLAEVIKTLPNVKPFLEFIEDETLEDRNYTTFSARDFEWKTEEYKACLLLDCLFGAKSIDPNVANEYQQRFDYLIDNSSS